MPQPDKAAVDRQANMIILKSVYDFFMGLTVTYLRRFVIPAGILAFLCFLFWPAKGFAGAGPVEPFASLFNDFETFSPSQDLPPLALRDLKGEIRTLGEFKGKYMVLNFWATWCPPCLKELPSLVALQEKYRDRNLQIVYVSLDFPASGAALKKDMQEKRLPGIDSFYAINPKMWSDWQVEGIPVSMIISPENKILYKTQGDIDWMSLTSLDFFARLTGQ